MPSISLISAFSFIMSIFLLWGNIYYPFFPQFLKLEATLIGFQPSFLPCTFKAINFLLSPVLLSVTILSAFFSFNSRYFLISILISLLVYELCGRMLLESKY